MKVIAGDMTIESYASGPDVFISHVRWLGRVGYPENDLRIWHVPFRCRDIIELILFNEEVKKYAERHNENSESETPPVRS